MRLSISCLTIVPSFEVGCMNDILGNNLDAFKSGNWLGGFTILQQIRATSLSSQMEKMRNVK